ncbi:hypothetical protein COHA_001701 [Chlorella ohadii]|uniref:Kazal-like domain-containing protein n=1 Tax=Chlorella ohadii TaxID=2649997 RepID=A0AAD5H9B6_9CHLO|nr:hypothetical protein COHA_001701 [Chlorella ohadii]
MDCRAVVVMALALCASCVSAHSSGRFLLQTNVTAPNVTGTTLAGFTFTANVGTYTLIPKDSCDISTALSAASPDFATADAIYTALKGVPQGILLLNYALHEAEGGLNHTRYNEQGDGNVNEAWALYAGQNGNCAGTIYSLVKQFSVFFGTLTDSYANRAYTCKIPLHEKILQAYKRMLAAGEAINYNAYKQALDEIVNLFKVPFVQGILKSAHEITANMAAGRDAKAAQATGYGYVQAIAPLISEVDRLLADILLVAFDPAKAPSAKTNDIVKSLLVPMLPKLGVKPELVGTLGRRTFLKCNGSAQALAACRAACPKRGSQVCGADGKTYANACEAGCYSVVVAKNRRC